MRHPSLDADGPLTQHGSNISNEQIAQAIVAIMRGPSGDGQFDPALASAIAGQVALTVNEHLRGVDPVQLAANATFRQLLSQRLDGSDANRKIESAAQTLRHANVTSADSAAAQALLGERASIIAGRLREGSDRGERTASGARFDAMGDSVAKRMDDARSLAVTLGMGWAVNNPDLLRLGPGAIKTLHEAGVRRETFERMVSERVGIRAETAVHFAAWARRHHLTPEQTNRLADSTSDLHESLSAGHPPEERRRIQRELDQAFDRYTRGPDTPEARRALEEERMRHARTEQQREQIRANARELEAAHRDHGAAAVGRDASLSNARLAENRTAAKVDDLDAIAAAGATPAVQPKPDAAQTVPAAPKAAAPKPS